MQQKNKGLIISLVLFIIITLLLGGYIIYDKTFTKSETPNNTLNNTINNENQKEWSMPWISYLLEQDIESIAITYCDSNMNSTKANITKDNLIRIFSEVEKGTITKHSVGGLGGLCTKNILIEYKHDVTKYDVNIYSGFVLDTNYALDPNLLQAIEDSEYIDKTEDGNLAEQYYYYELTYDLSIIDAIIDEYENIDR